ncbi:type I-E CRISPR-associated protein Cse2/CasB [Actinomadura geliboluensis]|uniref:Type I-E CRISPR-associated protein Cse2/CasB n=1 Tax=Actinomadura geliboluensis TaxID=882440 RepID=A0A5S4GKW5_9ACTN|nr:type I-E CRISPR-associated protein Cse2/CasB [Actinomadura geliboluensis]TMR33595.1 type I-E CRISPR-associated protein Cse2/CasB [Actinomadura geliboluensis]
MTTPTPARTNNTAVRASEFVSTVFSLCEDPGKRAALRSGLGRPLDRCHRMHQVIAARVPPGSQNSERAYYAVAAMIAALPPQARSTVVREAPEVPGPAGSAPDGASEDGAESTGNGTALRRNFGQCLAEGVEHGVLRESAAEARLSLLTRQSVDGVHRHLPATVRVLADRSSAVDWAQLLVDLCRWDRHRDQITRRWLQSFYRTRSAAERQAAEQADRAEHDEPDAE